METIRRFFAKLHGVIFDGSEAEQRAASDNVSIIMDEIRDQHKTMLDSLHRANMMLKETRESRGKKGGSVWK